MGTKRSKIFIEEVDKDILEKLLDGWTPFQIVEYLMENWDFVTVSNCKKRIDNVQKRMMVHNKTELEEKIALYKQQYYDIYQKARSAAEYKTANLILDSLVKLEGLLKDKIEIKSENVTTLNLENVTDQKLEELLNKIINNK